MGIQMRPRRSGGYLMVVLVVSLSAFTVAYLSFSSYSARIQDEVELQRSEAIAGYAAESGLVRAEALMSGKGFKPPPVGVWFKGDFSRSESRYSVEVLKQQYGPKTFTLRSVGEVAGEGGRTVTSVFEGRYVLQSNKGWVAEWRTKP